LIYYRCRMLHLFPDALNVAVILTVDWWFPFTFAGAGREWRHRHDTWAHGNQETAVVSGIDAVPVQEHDISGTRKEFRATDQCAQASTWRYWRGGSHGRQSGGRKRRARGVRHGNVDRVPRSVLGGRYCVDSFYIYIFISFWRVDNFLTIDILVKGHDWFWATREYIIM